MKSILHGVKSIVLSVTALCCTGAFADIADADIIRITASDIKSATWTDGSATINGCTVNLNGNTKNENGTISIITTAADGETAVDKGVTIDVPTEMQAGKYSAIVKYSNYSKGTGYSYVLGLKCSSNSDFGAVDDNNGLRGFWAESAYYSPSPVPATRASGYYMVSYNNAGGTALFSGETPKAYVGGLRDNIKWANSIVQGVNIGGKRQTVPNTVGKPASMTIEEVILVKGVYSQDTGSLDELKKLYASKEFVQKYGYDFNGSYSKETAASTNLGLGSGASIATTDCQVDGVKDKALSFATGRTGSYWGTSFAYGAGDWTLLASAKAPAANQCILSVGGSKGTAGLIGLRNASNNTVAAFTKDGADLTSVKLGSDPTTDYHLYAIVYDSATGKVKMNVDGGEFTEAVDFTPSSSGGFQFGGIYAGQIAGIAANANSGALDEFRLYSTALTQADTRELAVDLLDLIVIPEGEEKVVESGETLSAHGIVVDGTLKFTEQATSGNKVNRLNTGNVSGSGVIDLTGTDGQSGKNLNIAFIGNSHSFSGDIKIPSNVNCVFATSSVNVNDMQFSGGGFMCLYGATSAALDGTWTTAAGAYIGTGSTLNANGGTLTGRLYFCDNSNLVLGSLTETSLTITGERFETAGTLHITLPNGTPSEEKVTLISWKKTQGVTAARLDVSNIPAGYEVTYDESGLYLSMIEDSTETVTSAVSNRLSLPIVHIGNGGVQQFSGVGGVLIDDLQIRNGGKIVINPTRAPIKLSTAPVLEAGAKIALDPEHSACTLGKFTLLTWTGDAITPAADLFDTTSIPAGTTATITCEATPKTANSHQLILTVGDYEQSAKVIRIMPLGDSITDGTSYYSNQYEANPNYRVPLMKKLAAKGYKPVTTGLRECAFTGRYSTDAAGVVAPDDYRWHSGVSGARVRTATASAARGLNGGWREAIETTLDAAGDIDIITFKIGTNDAGNNKDYVFAGWKDVVTRILAARPNVKIVCASILNMNGDGTWEKSYNKLIEDEIAKTEAEGGFPAGHVFFVDLYNKCPRSTDGVSNFADNLHPNWIGHDRNSDAWLVGVEAAIAQMSFPTDKDTFDKNTNTGAENNVPEAYRKGYTKLAAKALPTTGQGASMQNTAAVYDTTTEGAADKTLSRVAYYVELKNKKTGHVRYVWTSMDAFGDKKLASVGLPTSYAKWGSVTNMRVVSNDSGIHNTAADATGITGRLQFTYGGCSAGAQSGVTPAALIAKWDWNDTISGSEASPSGTYGTMQVYRVFDNPEPDHNVAETIFAFNRWSATDSKATEIGIGNFAMHGKYTGGDTDNGSLNYMFTSGYETVDASAYELMNLEIWGVPEGGKTVEPGKTVEVTAASAAEAIAGVTIVIPEGPAKEAGQAKVVKLVASETSAGSGVWTVSVAIDENKIKSVETTLGAFGEKGLAAIASEEGEVSVTIPAESVTPGLYYSIVHGDSLDALTSEGERALATSAGVTVKVPATTGKTAQFFRVKASLAPNAN